MRFSPSTLGWYPTFLQYAQLPADLIEVPDALYKQLMGKPLEIGGDGMPREAIPSAESQVPSSVTMRQARLALLAVDKLGMVQFAISSLPSPQKESAQIDWEYAATVDRDSSTTQLLAHALGMQDDELDQLFLIAATL